MIAITQEMVFLTLILITLFLWLFLCISEYGKSITKIFLFKRKKNKHADIRMNIRNSFLARAKKLQNKLVYRNRKNVFEEFTIDMRRFFAELYNIKYNFTYEELIKTIKKQRIRDDLKKRIVVLLQTVSDLEYGGHEISLRSARNLILDFSGIIKDLLPEHEKKSAKGLKTDEMLEEEISKTAEKVYVIVNRIREIMKTEKKLIDEFEERISKRKK